jgi:hypothetical protein
MALRLEKNVLSSKFETSQPRTGMLNEMHDKRLFAPMTMTISQTRKLLFPRSQFSKGLSAFGGL